MEQGFSQSGALVASTSEHCRYVLTEHLGRPLFRSKNQTVEAGSMYFFGRVGCWAIKDNFDWTELLKLIPDPSTEEKRELKAKLLKDKERTMEFIRDEIDPEGISEEDFERIAEIFCRFFPAAGHFEDRWNFLSDNFYSFEPSWSFKSYHTAPDFKTLVEEAFGSYRKDLARAVAQSNGSTIALLTNFRDSLTAEQMVTALERSTATHCGGWSFIGTTFDSVLSDLRGFNRLSGALRFKLVLDLIEQLEDSEEDGFTTASTVEDTLAMLSSIPDAELKRFRSDRSWDQVHSRAVELASEEKIGALDPIGFPQEILQLDGESLGSTSLRLKLLRTPLEFLQAGSKGGLNNCMGKAGYYTKAKRGESYCFVAHSAYSLEVGIEVARRDDRWKVLQLTGPSNGDLANKAALKGELLARLNGEDPKDRSIGRSLPKLLPRSIGIAAEQIEAPVVPEYPRRPASIAQDPVDIPPLAELDNRELEEIYSFRATEDSAMATETGALPALPRVMSLRLFAERDPNPGTPVNFAFPLN